MLVFQLALPATTCAPVRERGRSHLNLGHFEGDRQRIFLGQRLAGLRTQAHTALRHRAGHHQHDVRAQALHLLLTRKVRPPPTAIIVITAPRR
jgi:hypothetical protein